MPPLRPRLPARAVLVLTLAWGLAGCGHTFRVGGSRTLHLALSEYRVTPDTVRAYAGTLKITVLNAGTRTHNLAISVGDQNEAMSAYLPPGARTTMTVDLPPGKYMLRSTVTDDQALGLWGTLDLVRTHRS